MNTIPSIDPQTETGKIVSFIQSTFQKTGKTKAIVAVSGGVDSATSLFLATKALRPENIYTLHLPAKNTNPQSTIDAQLVITSAQIPDTNSLTINIGSIIQKSWKIIAKYGRYKSMESMESSSHTSHTSIPFIRYLNKIRLANLAARIRMMLLFDQAKKLDALVVGTENLSEHLLGYYTRFGDEASDLEPIRHLYKTQVIQLANYLGIPKRIITKPPSADLWHGQTDAKELGFTYTQADPILYQIQSGKTPEASPLVEAISQQIQKNAFKLQVPYLPDL